MPEMRGRMAFLNPDDPEDLMMMVKSGVIWKTSYAQKGVDLIESGAIAIEDCEDVPEEVLEAFGLGEELLPLEDESLDVLAEEELEDPEDNLEDLA